MCGVVTAKRRCLTHRNMASLGMSKIKGRNVLFICFLKRYTHLPSPVCLSCGTKPDYHLDEQTGPILRRVPLELWCETGLSPWRTDRTYSTSCSSSTVHCGSLGQTLLSFHPSEYGSVGAEKLGNVSFTAKPGNAPMTDIGRLRCEATERHSVLHIERREIWWQKNAYSVI